MSNRNRTTASSNEGVPVELPPVEALPQPEPLPEPAPPTGTAPTSSPAKPRTRRRVIDPEIQAMAELDQIIIELEDDAVQRVLMWLVDRHGQPGFRVAIAERSDAPSAN